MAIKKNFKADLQAKYKRYFELSLIISLALLIIAFIYFPHFKPVKEIKASPQVLFHVQNIQQTVQQMRPPPPPNPGIPIAAPTTAILNNVTFHSTELNENVKMSAPPPPPKAAANTPAPHYFVAVEDMPQPIGGIAAIQNKIVYPRIAKRAGVQGIVFVKAFINKRGKVTKAEIIKGIGAGCNKAALKAVEETRFEPGKQRGMPVDVQMVLPVKFKLEAA